MAGLFALGIDIGGTQIRAALVDEDGVVVKRESVATNALGGPDVIVRQAVQLANDSSAGLSADAIEAIGVCAPGPLDSDTGVVLDIATLPGWQNYPLRRNLSEAFRRPILLENDGIAAAFGEWKHGAGKGVDNLVYVTVSTGLGGGVVVDGHLLRGHRGMAGHVGHMMINPDGPRCGCGGRGCFEAYASGTNFALAGLANGFASGEAIVDAARKGDAAAIELVNQEARYLGYGFASLMHLYSPQRLIIGGGVSKALDLLMPGIRAQIDDVAMPAFRRAEIVAALLGDNCGLVGVAGMAWRAAQGQQ
ncbi:MAG: ROK family protein [Rhizobiaceae bacterium]